MALTVGFYNGGIADEYLAIAHYFMVPPKLPFIRAVPCAAPYGALPPRDSHRGHSFPSRPRTRDLECALAGGTFFSRNGLVVLRLLLLTTKKTGMTKAAPLVLLW